MRWEWTSEEAQVDKGLARMAAPCAIPRGMGFDLMEDEEDEEDLDLAMEEEDEEKEEEKETLRWEEGAFLCSDEPW